MRWIASVLQLLLGAMFLFSAFGKLTGGVEDIREHLGIAPWFWTVTALTEIVGAAALLAGIKYPRLAVFGGLWLAAVMAGGLVSHAWVADPPIDMLAAAVLLALSLAVAALRWPAARIDVLLARSPRQTRQPANVVW